MLGFKFKSAQAKHRRVKRRVWTLLRLIPLFFRARIIRSMFEINPVLPENLVLKIADTQDELEQVFALLHDSFVEFGYMDASTSGMRITKYHALPSTTILIAKIGDEVIATLSVIQDTPMGLPLDSTWDLSDLRRSGGRLAEISALAIRKNYKMRRGHLLLPLCKFMYEYCTRCAGIDTIVVATHEQVKDFYRCVLLFDDLDGLKPKAHGFVKGAISVAQFLDLNSAVARYRKAYGHLPIGQNIFNYFYNVRIKNFIFPERAFNRSTDQVLTPALFAYFFKDKSRTLDSLTQQDVNLLKSLQVLSPTDGGSKNTSHQDRRAQALRNRVRCPARVMSDFPTQNDSVEVMDVSRGGIQLRVAQTELWPQRGVYLQLKIEVSNSCEVDFVGQVMWIHGARVGLKQISTLSKEWDEYVSYLENTNIHCYASPQEHSRKAA